MMFQDANQISKPVKYKAKFHHVRAILLFCFYCKLGTPKMGKQWLNNGAYVK